MIELRKAKRVTSKSLLTLQNLQCKKCKVGVELFLAVFLTAFFYLGVCPAYPEAVTFKSALVWRQDEKGDYKFKIPASDGTYEIDSAYTTDGNIETITAAWKFTGKVTLELSADNGLHYTPVVNGVPLAFGFVKGNQIKWKATLAADSELTEVRIVYTDTSGVIGSFGCPELSGFKFRKPIYINGSPQEELFNYQMKIRVAEGNHKSQEADVYCEGNIKSDFKDIRFTAQDGETPLPYYLENITGERPNRMATFWVKIPQIPQDGVSIYIYYGNPEAEDLSNGEDVFDFFDDFSGQELDTAKWELQTNLGGECNVANSFLKLDGARIISKDYQMENGIIEYRAKAEAGNEIRAIIRQQKEKPEFTQLAHSSSYGGAEHSIAVGNIVEANASEPILPGVFYDYRVIAKGKEITFQRYTQRSTQYAIPEAEVSFHDTDGLTRGHIGLEIGGAANTESVTYYDWLRVRKFAEQEPEVDTLQLAQQEQICPPVFTNTVIAENGNLILADKYTEGSYVCKEITSDFQTRIIVPSVRVSECQSVRVDISADGGATYKTNCANGFYYYASRGDFAAGSSLRFRLRLAELDPELRNTQEAIGNTKPGVQEVTLDFRPGNILLVLPNGGELWQAGSSQKILWLASEYEPTYPMRIEYSLDGGKTFNTIEEKRQNMGVYFWNVPETPSNRVIIRVSDALDGSIYDGSDRVFEIK